jgi:hypothetical protein
MEVSGGEGHRTPPWPSPALDLAFGSGELRLVEVGAGGVWCLVLPTLSCRGQGAGVGGVYGVGTRIGCARCRHDLGELQTLRNITGY